MSFPIYTLDVRRNESAYARGRDYGYRRSRWRDPRPKRGSAACTLSRVPVFRVVLRKERTIRVASPKITSPYEAAMVAHALIGDSPYEKLLSILIDSGSRVAGAVVISTTSTISSTAVSVRGIFTAAIAHNATAIVLAHNHPSGDPTASRPDHELLAKARPAADILGIPIVDNLIVTRDPDVWSSFC